MAEPDFSHLAAMHQLGDDPIPDVVLEIAGGRDGHQDEFFEAYGIEPDEERIRYYQLWHLES